MIIKAIYVIKDRHLGKPTSNWAKENNIRVIPVSQKNNKLNAHIDGAILIHENHNFNREDHETLTALSDDNIPVHKVDINGTLAATVSSFMMWLERNNTTKLLFLGDDKIIKNKNLVRFLTAIGKN